MCNPFFVVLKIKKKKGRQGRSAEVRARIAKERQDAEKLYQDKGINLNQFRVEMTCKGCLQTDFFSEDYSSGDVVCTNCGVIESTGGLGFAIHMPSMMTMCSKPYQRVVHFRQRLAQLLCRDPEQPQDMIDKMEEFIDKSTHRAYSNPQRFGYKTFSRMLKDLGYKTKFAEHWMQFRKRLNLWPYCTSDELTPHMVHRITYRFSCISAAFDRTLLIPKGKRGQWAPLSRHNVVNLNFIIIMLIRMENEAAFRCMAKYFPQMISQDQPSKNNKRLKILVAYCAENFRTAGDPSKGDSEGFDWPYKPITVQEILDYFTYFQ